MSSFIRSIQKRRNNLGKFVGAPSKPQPIRAGRGSRRGLKNKWRNPNKETAGE